MKEEENDYDEMKKNKKDRVKENNKMLSIFLTSKMNSNKKKKLKKFILNGNRFVFNFWNIKHGLTVLEFFSYSEIINLIYKIFCRKYV